MRANTSIIFLITTAFHLGLASEAYSLYSFDFKLCNFQIVTGGVVPVTQKTVTRQNDVQGLAPITPETALSVNQTQTQDFLELVCLPVPINNEKYQLKAIVSCPLEGSSSEESNFYVNLDADADTNGVKVVNVEGSSKYGCLGPHIPEIVEWVKLTEMLLYVTDFVLITVGVLLLVLGVKVFNFSLFAFVATVGTFIASEIIKAMGFLSINETWSLVAIYTLSASIGILLGYKSLKLRKTGFFIGGFLGGFALGYSLLEVVVSLLESQRPNALLTFVILLLWASKTARFLMNNSETVIIVASSIGGGQLLNYVLLADIAPLVSIGMTCTFIVFGICFQLKQKWQANKSISKNDPKKATQKMKAKAE